MLYDSDTFVIFILNLGQIESIKLPLEDEWAEEFSNLSAEEIERREAREREASYNQDFWKNLEAEWKQQLEANSKSADWLEEFESYVPYENYEFVEDNPLQSHENCLEEGKKKLAEGEKINIFKGICNHGLRSKFLDKHELQFLF